MNAARDLAAGVGPVIPVKGKAPLWKDWTTRATSDPVPGPDWEGATGVGLVTGARAGYFVLDVDTEKGGGEALQELERQIGALPPTWTTCTGGGGRHYFFMHPGFLVRGSAGRLGRGLDVRGEGGQVVAPGSRSRHPQRQGRTIPTCSTGCAHTWRRSRGQCLVRAGTIRPGSRLSR